MTSVGRRLQALNFRGRAGKGKKGDKDELELDHNAYVALRKSSCGTIPGMGLGKPTKSNSLGSISAEVDGALDQDDIMTLTQDVRCFSDSLSQLKTVFTNNDAESGHSMHVQAHKELGEVLYSLRSVLSKYPALHTTDVLTAAAVLITKVKSANYEDMASELTDLHFSIDQLALAFSSSVSEYLMGDVDSYPIGKSKSYDNLHGADSSDFGSTDNLAKDGLSWNADDLDATLMKFEDGVDLALSRAKAWAKYAKDVATYVEKRTQMEFEFAKNLSKLATGVRQTITDDSYLPFQSIYCTALDHDRELASTTQTCSSLLQQEKFVEPLLQRRLDHERSRKCVKDQWTRELRKMQEAVGNMRKAKALYVQRQMDYDKAVKARDQATTRAEQDLSASSSSTTAKADKKRKLEEEAMHRAIEAETTYKACVIEANNRQHDLENVKGLVLEQIREIIMESEQTMKSVTVGYFKLQHAVMAPLPVQYLTLYESCEQYEPGAQYAEYVRHLPVTTVTTPEPFTFEAFTAETKLYERKPSTQSSGSGSSDIQGLGEDSPSPGRHGGEKSRLLKGWGHGGSDSDSISGSSCKSRESSPSASPYPRHRTNLIPSSSMNELAEADRDAQYDSRAMPTLGEIGHGAFRSTNMSRAGRTHNFRKLRAPSKCRQCDSYVYFQGAECDKCGISSHKKCLESLQYECGYNADVSQERQNRRMTTFGVDLNALVGETDSLIPHVIQRCAAEIDRRGLHVKGIYRVSGVKSKVERLCQTFEIHEDTVDLSEHPPVVIANVLKLYLRQLPEPLLSFQLYQDFMRVAKEECEHPEEMVVRLKALMAQLPAANFSTCAMLMHHLFRVAEEKEINQMTAGNLGIVFGPTLLRPSEGAASLNSLMDTPLQTHVVEILIDKVTEIFGPEVKAEREEDKDTPVRELSEKDSNSGEQDEEVHGSFDNIGLDKADVKWCLVTDTLPRSKARHRYIPESTENLMDELAKEDQQLFQQVREDYVNLPGSTVANDGKSDVGTDANDGRPDGSKTPTGGATHAEDSDEALPEIPLPDCSTSQPLLVPSPSDLMRGASHLLPISVSLADEDHRRLHVSTSTPALHSSASSDSGSVKSMNVSPGLRRRLIASDLRSRTPPNTIGGSTFYSEMPATEAETVHQVPILSQPRSFTPPPLGGDAGPAHLSRSTFYTTASGGSPATCSDGSGDHQSQQSDSSTAEEREPQYV